MLMESTTKTPIEIALQMDKDGFVSCRNPVSYTHLAGRKVLNRAYPFREDITEVPERYKDVQIRAAVELFSKMGAEGQTSHSENSISRVWESADISNSVLAEIIPHAGVI